MQTKPVQQKSQGLGRYADGKVPLAQQPAEAAVSESKDRFRRFVERSAKGRGNGRL